MRMHPHKACEEFQERRRLFLGLLKNSSVLSESRDNFRVGVGKGVVGISLEQQNEGCLRGQGICHTFVKRAADTKGYTLMHSADRPNRRGQRALVRFSRFRHHARASSSTVTECLIAEKEWTAIQQILHVSEEDFARRYCNQGLKSDEPRAIAAASLTAVAMLTTLFSAELTAPPNGSWVKL